MPGTFISRGKSLRWHRRLIAATTRRGRAAASSHHAAAARPVVRSERLPSGGSPVARVLLPSTALARSLGRGAAHHSQLGAAARCSLPITPSDLTPLCRELEGPSATRKRVLHCPLPACGSLLQRSPARSRANPRITHLGFARAARKHAMPCACHASPRLPSTLASVLTGRRVRVLRRSISSGACPFRVLLGRRRHEG